MLYSVLYDRFYRDKDYSAECDMMEITEEHITNETRETHTMRYFFRWNWSLC